MSKYVFIRNTALTSICESLSICWGDEGIVKEQQAYGSGLVLDRLRKQVGDWR